MSATNFNNAEQGILTAHSMLDLLYTFIMLKLSYSDHTLDSLDAAKLDLHGKADSAGKPTNWRIREPSPSLAELLRRA